MSTETTPPTTKRVRKTSPPPPVFDYTAVKLVDAEPPTRSNGKAKANNPTVPWLQESWDNRTETGQKNGHVTYLGKGKKVTIPTANVRELRNLLNYAARDLDIGVSIKVKDVPGGKSIVNFAAKSRNERKVKATA